ncbi:type I restriction-modification system S subunit [Bifidobacterium porcinum]|nr:type I restriction-modification system S subunit [Bifidobacterium porcinum]
MIKAKDLRNSILQMAVRGKLVPQNPADEPASVLLARIRDKRRELVAQGKLKFPKGGESVIYRASDGSPYEKRIDAKGRVISDECIQEEIPFEIPETWEWARLGSVINLMSGIDLPTADFNSKHEGIPYLTGASNFNRGELIENRWTTHAKRISKKGDLLFTCKGTIGEMAINRFEFAHIARQIMAIQPNEETLLDYIATFLESLILAIRASAKGVIPGIERNTLLNALFPVPPLAEQERIAARVDELSPLVDEFGSLEERREALDSALPRKIRQSVLQEAVEGRLVEQNPADEPASVLLARIRDERRGLVAEGKLKFPKNGESVIYRASDGARYEKRIDAKGRVISDRCIQEEIPFDIPKTWEWARLETVCTYISRGKSPTYSPLQQYPVVAQKCNQWNGFSLDRAKFVDPETVTRYSEEQILHDGDLLWNSTGLGTLGRMAIYDSSKNKYGWAVADSHVTVIRTGTRWVDYLFVFFLHCWAISPISC